jgi:prepilin-type N-terminal cleavage/methylation domain-containing protein
MTTCNGLRKANVRGFTLIELLVVLFIIGVMIALLLPNVRVAREAARRMSCSNNAKNLALAIHNYHEAHGQFPSAMGGTGGDDELSGNQNRLSGFVGLLPYIEQGTLWSKISAPSEFNGQAYPTMGPAPWVSEYEPWTMHSPVMRCPSAGAEKTGLGRTNYTFCIGDVAQQIHEPATLRGMFACRMTSSFQDIADGTAQTIMLCEIGAKHERKIVGQFAVQQPAGLLQDPSLCLSTLDTGKTSYAKSVPVNQHGRGARWADGAAGYSLVNTILPPNSPSCAVGGTEAVDGIYSAGSEHGGGAIVAKGDGSVTFINEDVDAGDPHQPPPTPAQIAKGPFPSPYGVWGAMGTAAGEEPTK